MVHGLKQIEEMNRNAENWERLVKAGIVPPGVPRRITDEEMEKLREIEAKAKKKTRGLAYLLGGPLSPEKERELDEYLKRHPVSIRIQPRRPRRREEDD